MMGINQPNAVPNVKTLLQIDRNAGWRVMDFLPTLWVLLAAAALVDWLVTRTVTRFAIFIPKTPAMITGYQALT